MLSEHERQEHGLVQYARGQVGPLEDAVVSIGVANLRKATPVQGQCRLQADGPLAVVFDKLKRSHLAGK